MCLVCDRRRETFDLKRISIWTHRFPKKPKFIELSFAFLQNLDRGLNMFIRKTNINNVATKSSSKSFHSPEFNIKKSKTIKHAVMLPLFMKELLGRNYFLVNVFLFARNSLLIRAYHSRRVIIDIHVSLRWINLFHMFHLHVLSIILMYVCAPVQEKWLVYDWWASLWTLVMYRALE